jgi:hypothetical protein
VIEIGCHQRQRCCCLFIIVFINTNICCDLISL